MHSSISVCLLLTLIYFVHFEPFGEQERRTSTYRITHAQGSVFHESRRGVFHYFTCVFVLYKVYPFILGFNDGLDDDPFLPVGQHDAAVKGRQLQGRRAKQAVIPFGGHRLSSKDDKTH